MAVCTTAPLNGSVAVVSVPITHSSDGKTYGYIKVFMVEEYFEDGNNSTLKVTKMTGSNTLRSGSFRSAGSISIDGTTWYSWGTGDWTFSGLSGDDEFTTYSGKKYPSGLTIQHDSKGEKTITVTVNITSYYGSDPTWTGKGGTVSESVALTKTRYQSFQVYRSGEYKTAVPYAFKNGTWQEIDTRISRGGFNGLD